MPSSYIIRGGEAGRSRLSVLSQAMADATGALLDRAGPWDGLHVLDAGCGGGDVSRALAERVGPSGRVLGVDGDAVKIAAARIAAEDQPNLAFEVADITAASWRERFDAVYARFLLSHLPEPAPVLERFRQALRPGGRILVEDVDFSGHFVSPPLPAFDAYVGWYREAARRRGADADIGPRLPGLLTAAGFTDIEAQAVNPAGLTGPVKHMAALTLAAIADAVAEAGIATADEIDAALTDLRTAANDPTVMMSLPRVVQVTARRA